MATIAEIRQQYPQYSDMTDMQLADAFHSKFYSDIPKDTFYTQLGMKTKQLDRCVQEHNTLRRN